MGCCNQRLTPITSQNPVAENTQEKKPRLVSSTMFRLQQSMAQIRMGVSDNNEASVIVAIQHLSKIRIQSNEYVVSSILQLLNSFFQPNTQNFPMLIREKMNRETVRLLLTLLSFLQIQSNPFTEDQISSSLSQLEEVKKIRLQNQLGVIELSFYLKLIFEILMSLKQKKQSDISFLIGFGKLTLGCFGMSGNAQGVLETVWDNTHTSSKRNLKKGFLRKFTTIQELTRQAIFNKNEQVLQKLRKWVQEQSDSFTKTTCLFSLQNICNLLDNRGPYLQFLIELAKNFNLDSSLRAQALRICMQLQIKGVHPQEQQKLTDMFDDLQYSIEKEQDLLIKVLIWEPSRFYLEKSLKTMHQNWYFLTGIDQRVYYDILKKSNREIEGNSKNYIELYSASTRNGEHLMKAKDRIKEFLQSSQKVLLLLGSSGSGKTLFLKRLQNSMLKIKHQFFPVYLNLGRYLKFLDGSLIEKAMNDLNIDSKHQIFKQRSILFILDAYNEL